MAVLRVVSEEPSIVWTGITVDRLSEEMSFRHSPLTTSGDNHADQDQPKVGPAITMDPFYMEEQGHAQAVGTSPVANEEEA